LDQLAAAGYALAVCTNKPHEAALRVLAKVGLEGAFDAVLGGDAAPAQKPDPRHAGALLDRLGAEPASALMVGDGPADIGCARAAGIPVIAVSWGYGRIPAAELGADHVIDAFGELPALARRLLG
jgi:phosphoglycolate phosphatase